MREAVITQDPEAQVAAVEARGRRIDTPRGDGTVARYVWGGQHSARIPVVLGHGAQGGWSHGMRGVHPDADFRVIADAGHWTMCERAKAFNATLIDMHEAGSGAPA